MKRYALIFPIGLMVSTSPYAQEPVAWTGIETCSTIVNQFNHPEIDLLTQGKKANIRLLSTDHDHLHTGCFIQVNAEHQGVSKEIGGVLIYRQANAYQIYKNNKKQFIANTHPIKGRKSLTYVKEGFTDTSNTGY